MSAEQAEKPIPTAGEMLGQAFLCCDGSAASKAMIAMALHAGIVPVSADPGYVFVEA